MLHEEAIPEKERGLLRIVSFNVGEFGMPPASDEPRLPADRTAAEVAKFVVESSADLVLFQEFPTEPALIEAFRSAFVEYSVVHTSLYKGGHQNLAVFTKPPNRLDCTKFSLPTSVTRTDLICDFTVVPTIMTSVDDIEDMISLEGKSKISAAKNRRPSLRRSGSISKSVETEKTIKIVNMHGFHKEWISDREAQLNAAAAKLPDIIAGDMNQETPLAFLNKGGRRTYVDAFHYLHPRGDVNTHSITGPHGRPQNSFIDFFLLRNRGSRTGQMNLQHAGVLHSPHPIADHAAVYVDIDLSTF